MNINLTFQNFTDGGLFRMAFNPYVHIFGEFTWGIIFGFIGAAIYVNERSISIIATYLILVGAFVSIIFPSHIVAVFGLILAFIVTVIFYQAFFTNRN